MPLHSNTSSPIMTIPAMLEGRLRLPVIGAPMFIVSTPALVLAQCKSGIVGAFPALNARPQHVHALATLLRRSSADWRKDGSGV